MSDDDEHERRNRQLDQLLQETRVIMPGVQVLFAFLLAVTFQQQFQKTTGFQKDVFLVTILGATAATVCFIAPAAWHRILFQQKDKRHIIRVSNRFVISGLVLLSLSMTSALVLVCDVAFSGTTAAVVPALAFSVFGWFWFVAPLMRRHKDNVKRNVE
jgi:predicted membrane channel-forming protein YqfA (hemolysin III family)